MDAPQAKISDVLVYGKPYWRRYLIGGFTIFAVNALEMVAPAGVALAVNLLKGAEPPGGWMPEILNAIVGTSIPFLCMVMVISLVLQFGLRYVWRVCFIFTREYVAEDLRREFFHKLTLLPQSFYNRSQTGELMSLATNDVDSVRMMMGPGILLCCDSIAYFTFILLLLFSWHVQLTLYLLCVLPFVPLCVYYFSRQIHFRFERVQNQLALLSSHGQEAFAGVGVIKNFVRERSEVERFGRETGEYMDYQLSLARIQALFWPLMIFFVGIEAFIVLWVGGSAVKSGDLQLGEFIGFFLALWLLTWPTVALGWIINMFMKGTASMGRIKKVLEHEEVEHAEQMDGNVEELQGDIEFKEVTFTYPISKEPALKGVSFEVSEGDTVAVVGPVGSGKSTLMRLLLNIHPLEHGGIYLSGQSVSEFPSSILRRQVGYMPQENFLFSTTIAGNIALGLDKVDMERVVWAAQMACIHDEIEEFDLGYDTMLGERGVNLSGGQKQRVAIARALAMRPKILVLDDCLSSVDAETEERILSNLKVVREDCTALISTHRLTSVSDASFAVVLEGGEITQMGRHESLMKEGGWYQSTYRQQLLEKKLREAEDDD